MFAIEAVNAVNNMFWLIALISTFTEAKFIGILWHLDIKVLAQYTARIISIADVSGEIPTLIGWTDDIRILDVVIWSKSKCI